MIKIRSRIRIRRGSVVGLVLERRVGGDEGFRAAGFHLSGGERGAKVGPNQSSTIIRGVSDRVEISIMKISGISSMTMAGLLGAASLAHAENWAQFRGPHFDGSSPEKNLPAQFSKTENVAWSADMPG